jgi:flagellar biosynthesis anti-sigma factor FlgM
MWKNIGFELKLSNFPPIVELQGNAGRENMRIEGNPAAQALPENGRSTNLSATATVLHTDGSAYSSASGSIASLMTSSQTSFASGSLGEDQAELSGFHAQVRALAGQALQFPEIRQEKVNALRQAVLAGTYQPSSKQIADAVLAHMQA